MKRFASALLLVLTLLVGATSISTAHAAPARPQFSECQLTAWYTMDVGAKEGPYGTPTGVYEQVDFESLHDSSGEWNNVYCGYIRSKNTVTRTSAQCNTQMQAFVVDHNGFYDGSLNRATWSGCGGSYYALYSFSVYTNNYPCPWMAEGQIIPSSGGSWRLAISGRLRGCSNDL